MERTQSIIKNYGGEYEFTLLMNCLLGLVLLTCERIKQNPSPSFQVMIEHVNELESVVVDPNFTFQPVTKAGNPQPRTLANFIKRMRNSIAHANVYPDNVIIPETNQGQWIAVFFLASNIYATGQPVELDARFDFNQLKEFAVAISTLYQKDFLGL